MADDKHLEALYQPGRHENANRQKVTVEQEQERYYDLVHLKLPPRRLKRLSIVNVVLLIGCLLLFAVSSLVFAKPTFSSLEKRDLAKFPQFSLENLFSGQYTRDIEAYFSDTFPARDWFVGFSAVLNENRGIRMDDVRILAPVAGKNTEQQQAPAPSQPSPNPPQSGANLSALPADSSSEEQNVPSSSEQESSDGNEMVGAISNGMFVYKGMAMSLYGGSDSNAQWYAEVINNYHRDLPGVQIYNMVIPSPIEFYVPDQYRSLTRSQKETIDLIYSTLDSAVKKVDAYSQLQAHKDEYIYFRTDHHWTGLGAYYAYVAFCDQAGLTPLKISDFTTKRLENFIGTMYSQTQDSTLLKNPDYVDYYLFNREYEAQVYPAGSPYRGMDHNLWGEYAVSPNSYSVFLQGDFPLIAVKTDIHNGRKVMIVKESYGNAFAPFLINHYEEVYIVDQRYFERPVIEFIKEKGVNELIFANNTFAACTPYHIRCIEGLRTASYIPPAPKAPVVTATPSPEPVVEAPSVAEEPAPTPAPKKKSASNTGGGLLKKPGNSTDE